MTHVITTNKKLIIAISVILGTVILAAGIAWFYLSPSNYVSLDVNPSFELETNRLDKVVSITASNDDAAKILENYRPDDRDLDDVIEDLVDRMIFGGYLTGEKDNDILITVSDKNVSQDTLDKVNHRIASYLDQCKIKANVIGQDIHIDDNLRKSAKENHISTGKMAMIEQLLLGDQSLTAQQLAEMRVSDLIDYAKEHNLSLEALEEQLDDLDDMYQDPRYEQLEDQLDDYNDQYDNDDQYDDDRFDDDQFDDDDDWYDDDDQFDDDDDWYDDDDQYDDDDRHDDDDDRYDDDDDRYDDDDDQYDDHDD